MKKIFLITILLSIFASISFAQGTPVTAEKNESKWSNLSYYNVPVLKVLEAKDGFVVIYQKDIIGTASVIIPKKWFKGTPDAPRKLKIRNIKNPNESYMTIVKKSGEFHRVILTIPTNKNNTIWGLVDASRPLEGLDKETLEELDL